MRAFVLLAAICALSAAGCGGEREAPAGSPQETSPAPAAPPEASTREPAPDVSGQTLEGELVSLADQRGRAVFVNVWSSW